MKFEEELQEKTSYNIKEIVDKNEKVAKEDRLLLWEALKKNEENMETKEKEIITTLESYRKTVIGTVIAGAGVIITGLFTFIIWLLNFFMPLLLDKMQGIGP